MAEQLNIYQKLAKIRESVEVMQRDTKAYGYFYVKEEDLLAKITAGMKRYHLSLIPNINPGTTNVIPYTYGKTKTTKSGEIYEEKTNEILVAADMTFTWVDNDDPASTIQVPWSMVGQQSDASQAFGSGLTYSNRYFLLKYFNVATPNDDPDSWRSKQKEAEDEENRVIAESIVQLIDAEVKAYLDSNKKAAGEVKEFIGGYVKGGNYFNITDPVVAQQVLDGFKKKFNTVNT